MNILITNDDGYRSNGIRVLTQIMQQFGNVTVIAPETAQSGMSMAVSLSAEKIIFRELKGEDCPCRGARWTSLDATPASCVKFALSTNVLDSVPDLVVSGINHGANTAANAGYSGTLGAAAEAAVNHILGIGVSICDHNPDADLSAIEKLLPSIIDKLLKIPVNPSKTYYNINFPSLPADRIRGIRAANMGHTRWYQEFKEREQEKEGERLFYMSGYDVSEEDNTDIADHLLVNQGYVSIVPHTVDSTDYAQLKVLQDYL